MLKWKIVTQAEKILEDKERLELFIKNKIEQGYAFDAHLHERMARYEPTHEKYKTNYKSCDSCGEAPEELLETEFSFCDEYSCRMKLCKKCVDEITKIAENLR